MIVIWIAAAIVGVSLIMAGIFVPISPLSEILISFGAITLFCEILVLVESYNLFREQQMDDSVDEDEKDGNNNE